MVSKKSSSTASKIRNPDRRNGKAWKKGADGVPAPPDKRVVKVRVRTPERLAKDDLIREQRAQRRRNRREQEELTAGLAAVRQVLGALEKQR
jgi:hypothetical protein